MVFGTHCFQKFVFFCFYLSFLSAFPHKCWEIRDKNGSKTFLDYFYVFNCFTYFQEFFIYILITSNTTWLFWHQKKITHVPLQKIFVNLYCSLLCRKGQHKKAKKRCMVCNFVDTRIIFYDFFMKLSKRCIIKSSFWRKRKVFKKQ